MPDILAETVSHGCAPLPTAHVAALFGLHWSAVRLLDQRRLEATLAALPPAQPTRRVMDEFALYKDHRYATVVLDADTRRVLWIGEGRSRAAIRPFFRALGPEGCARIEAVAMDMNTASTGGPSALSERTRGLRPVPCHRQVRSRGDRPGGGGYGQSAVPRPAGPPGRQTIPGCCCATRRA